MKLWDLETFQKISIQYVWTSLKSSVSFMHKLFQSLINSRSMVSAMTFCPNFSTIVTGEAGSYFCQGLQLTTTWAFLTFGYGSKRCHPWGPQVDGSIFPCFWPTVGISWQPGLISAKWPRWTWHWRQADDFGKRNPVVVLIVFLWAFEGPHSSFAAWLSRNTCYIKQWTIYISNSQKTPTQTQLSTNLARIVKFAWMSRCSQKVDALEAQLVHQVWAMESDRLRTEARLSSYRFTMHNAWINAWITSQLRLLVEGVKRSVGMFEEVPIGCGSKITGT